MKSLSLINRRAGAIFASAALALSATVPALVSAATVTDRSISLSDSAKGATAQYDVKFTAQDANTNIAHVDFCTTASGSCTAPTGIDTSAAAVVSGATTAATVTGDKGIKITLSATAGIGDPVDVKVSGIVNPSAAGVFYARIATYNTDTWTDANTLGTHLGDGVVALEATDGFEVKGQVLETLTFCVSGPVSNDAPANCGAAVSPNVTLGSSGVLSDTAGTDGDVYSLIATNASKGAVVNLKSDAVGCGGLYRDGVSDTTHCGIGPIFAAAAALNDSDAKFGAKLALTQPAGGGTLAAGSGWSTSQYYMPWVSGDATGVTSVYGAKVFDTNNAPTNQGSAKLSFNANSNSLVPAGNYAAKFSLIATGTF